METLEVFWVVSMLVLGLVFSWGAFMNDRFDFIIAAVCSLIMSVVFAWNNALTCLYLELQMLLPDYRTELNQFTALFGMSLLVFVGLMSVIFSPFLFMDKYGNVTFRNCIALTRFKTWNNNA